MKTKEMKPKEFYVLTDGTAIRDALLMTEEEAKVVMTATGEWYSGEWFWVPDVRSAVPYLLHETQSTDEPSEPAEPEHDGVNCGCKSFDDCPGR